MNEQSAGRQTQNTKEVDKAKEEAELLKRIAKLRGEIRKEEELQSRRRFLRVGTAGIGGLIAGGVISKFGISKLLEEDTPPKKDLETKAVPEITKTDGPETRPREQIIREEIAECAEIIKNRKYEEVLKHPFFVSALYYSEGGIAKMGPPHQSGPEEIIWNIHQLITTDFRESYVKTLQKMFAEKSPEGVGAQSSPVDGLSFGKDLKRNHQDAIDIFAPEGSPVYATNTGLVVLAENGWKEGNDLSTSSNRGGNTVIIFNPQDESFYRYAHLERTTPMPGTVIKSGAELGVVGHTGINASKPGHGEHLHFEINKWDEVKKTMAPVNVFELKKMLEAPNALT